MKKRIFTLIFSVVLVLVMSFTAFADTAPPRLVDDADLLTDAEEVNLLAQLDEISERQQMDLVIVTVESTNGEDKDAFAEAYYHDNGFGQGDTDDGALLLISKENNDWCIYTCGNTSEFLTSTEIESIGERMTPYFTTEDYFTACVIFAQFCDDYLSLSEEDITSVSFENTAPPRVIDDADLLTDAEKANLLAQLDEISERQQVDVVVVTVESTDGLDVMAFADDYYDYSGYGQGENRDGVLLLISMEERDWWISTCGYGIDAITDYDIETIGQEMGEYLSGGDYATAFEIYAQKCDECITIAKEGEGFNFGATLLAAIVIGAIVALIVTLVEKSKLKSVRSQPAAISYMKSGSMQITQSGEYFLYRHVSRREKPKNNSGSSTHVSSSGTTHGGGGGKF